MENKDRIKLAAKLLKISESEAEEYASEMGDEIDALYFAVPLIGGPSLIVQDENNVLWASSAVTYEMHIEAFKNGTRTPLDAFGE